MLRCNFAPKYANHQCQDGHTPIERQIDQKWRQSYLQQIIRAVLVHDRVDVVDFRLAFCYGIENISFLNPDRLGARNFSSAV
jgi:hypothetical protein